MVVNCRLDLIGSEVLDGVDCSGVTNEAQYHELFWKAMRHDLLQKRGIKDPQNGRSWPTMGMQFVFIDLLPHHLHQVLNVRSLRGSGWLALIRVFLEMWGTWIDDAFD